MDYLHAFKPRFDAPYTCNAAQLHAMGEHWTDRLDAEAKVQGVALDELDRRIGVPVGRARTYKNKRTDAPRNGEIERYAEVLGVEPLWLRFGIEPQRPGDTADPSATAGDELLHRREMAQRIKGARVRRRIATPEAAALGTIIRPARWRQIEGAAVAPTPLELQAISERLASSLDWLVSGHVTPIDDDDPAARERVRKGFHETAKVTRGP